MHRCPYALLDLLRYTPKLLFHQSSTGFNDNTVTTTVKCSYCSLVPNATITKDINYQVTNVEMCVLGTLQATAQSLHGYLVHTVTV